MLGLDMFFGDIMTQIVDWVYGQVVGLYATFFNMMSFMGIEVFSYDSVKSVILFFNYLGWAFFGVGLVVAVFETAIEYQSGRADLKGIALNSIKGFLAVSLFTIVPVELYALTVQIQSSITNGITGLGTGIDELVSGIMTSFGQTPAEGMIGDLGASYSITNPVFMLVALIMFVYALLKVFFANLKRGGILIVQICIGSLYIFSIPRGFIDGFTGWFKKIIALCVTSLLQVSLLVIGMLILNKNLILGMGVMLASAEVPRIAEVFGLDTSTKTNFTGAVHATQSIVNTTKSIASIVAK